MPSTITIIPSMNTMVDQLMPVLDSDEPTQKPFWIKPVSYTHLREAYNIAARY